MASLYCSVDWSWKCIFFTAHEFDARKRLISKNFHHVLRVSGRQPLVGPPESMREHVVAASKAMKIGDWKSCSEFIINEKMNAKVSLLSMYSLSFFMGLFMHSEHHHFV